MSKEEEELFNQLKEREERNSDPNEDPDMERRQTEERKQD